jgi:centrosomal protein CEP95
MADGPAALSGLLSGPYSNTHHLSHHCDPIVAGGLHAAPTEYVHTQSSETLTATKCGIVAPNGARTGVLSTSSVTSAISAQCDTHTDAVSMQNDMHVRPTQGNILTQSSSLVQPTYQRLDQLMHDTMALTHSSLLSSHSNNPTDGDNSALGHSLLHGTSEVLLQPESPRNTLHSVYREPQTSRSAEFNSSQQNRASHASSNARNVSFKDCHSEQPICRSSGNASKDTVRACPDRPLVDAGVETQQPAITISPRNYHDYLRKYYRDTVHPHRTKSAGDDDTAAYLSDGCVDYNNSYGTVSDRNSSCEVTSFEQQLAACKQQLQKKAKAVRFEDYLDDSAPGYTGGLRRQFKAEDQKSRMKKELIAKVYEDELCGLAEFSNSEVESLSKSAKATESKYKKLVLKPPQIMQYRTNKFAKPVSVLRPQSSAHRHATVEDHKRSASASPDIGHGRKANHKKLPDNDMFPWLLEEFPYLPLTPATLHHLWHKGSLQLEQLSRADAEVRSKKSKAQQQIEEAERRQQLLIDILHKEQLHRQRLKEARDRRQLQLTARSKVREHRLQSARVRKYYEEFQVQQRSRMLKKRTKEELVFRRLFNDGLDIQKEHVRELRKYAKSQRLERSKQQQQELEALENYYKVQFALLAESMEREKNDVNTREKAQTKVLLQMKHELRKKMEQEISELQRRLWQDEDDVYFRELDAERMRRELRAGQYQAHL